jgi:hypothetical protein
MLVLVRDATSGAGGSKGRRAERVRISASPWAKHTNLAVVSQEADNLAVARKRAVKRCFIDASAEVQTANAIRAKRRVLAIAKSCDMMRDKKQEHFNQQDSQFEPV